ncbi:hypothetical protein FHS19_002560 [Paenibacillus rhizosphaerae]|uniref:F0F1-type ATP synthase n=1 Tax=Paenibacillus rhizosphaerae TaxID=297318 RepID=A0A839TM71_9BACL|nr:hypothetical protein [Paenibacillus rhizosphaerae]MBB3127906.1 hypothetical protein [Paenibacillus rhizosphaerae]
MKITDFCLVFVVIFFPVFLIVGYHVQDQRNVHFTELKYAAALRTAVQDAGSMLNVNERQEFESGYGSAKFFKADKELALETLYRTLYANLGIEDDAAAQQALNSYIPAIVVVDYDGYWVYSEEEYKGADGVALAKHLWHPKKPYSYSDRAGNLIHFTLDNVVEAYHAGTGTWVRGLQREIGPTSTIPLMQDGEKYEQVRKTTIVQAIEDDLANVINRHNEIAARNGVSYVFTLPLISREEWNNSIDDIGIIAFIQGIPIGEQALNNYALGSGRLVKSTVIKAGVDRRTGIRYYSRGDCTDDLDIVETFTSAKEAAANGYFEKSCSRAIEP